MGTNTLPLPKPSIGKKSQSQPRVKESRNTQHLLMEKSCKVKLQVVWIHRVVQECRIFAICTEVILNTTILIMWSWVVVKGAS